MIRFLHNTLINDATVSGLVGDKVYPHLAPPNVALPYITYSVISEVPNSHTLSTGGDSVESRVQVNCWAETYIEAINIYEAMKDALVGASGSVSGGKTVQAILATGGRDDFEPPVSGKHKGVYGRSEDFTAWSH